MKKSPLKLLSLVISCALLFSCSDFTENDSSKTDYSSLEKITLTGKIGINGALPSSIASAQAYSALKSGRTALPDIPTDSKYFFIKAKDKDLESAAFETGSVEDGVYYIGLAIGRRFTITAGLSSDENHNDVLLSRSWDTEIVTRDNAATFGKDVFLKPETGATGTVSLQMTVDSSIASVSCDNQNFTISGSGTTYTVTQSGSEISSGIYSVTFKFLSEDNSLLFYNTQTINVFENMETNKWVSGGGSADPIDSNGSFNVTSDLISKFARTQIYVGDTSWGDASNTGDGSSKSPYSQLSYAFDLIKKYGDSSTNYTIWVSGEIIGTSTIPDEITSEKANSIRIFGTSGNETDILNGNTKGTTLTINTSVPVTIKNLKITGGSGTYGGGIYLGSGSNVTLSESTVTKNESKSYGGGIAVVCATLTIDKSSITENKTTKEDKGVGGGIAIVGDETVTDKVTAKVTMKAGSVISGNSLYPNKNGGGVALYIGKTQFTMEGGEISGNTAYAGGGVSMWNDAEFIFKDGKISGNTATHSSGIVGGGGIYFCNQASLVMSGGEISGNVAKDFGGGVAFADNEKTPTFTMTGGVIKNNTITKTAGLGKGVSVNGTFNMSGNALVDSTNDVYLASGKVITITGKLESTTTVAKITPSTYTDSVQVLDLATNPTPATTLLSEYKKFEVVPDGSTKYYISSDGKIFSTKPATHFTTVPTSSTTVGLATIDDFKQLAEWVGDSNELSGVTLSLLTDVTFDSSFTPVGEYYTDWEVNNESKVRKLFTGIFDGNNKTITYDSVSFTQKYSGIFSGAKNATIQNVKLDGTLNINTEYAGGALIGHAEACIIKNCSSSVNITAGSSAKYYLGGIVGKAEGSYISGQKYERNCYILDCVNTSSIIADNGMYIGGIAGSASVCVIRNCINKGNISGVKMCGGIVGSTTLYGSDNYGSLIENCGNNGNITATSDYFSSEGSVGGIAGGPTAGNEEWAPKINNCYSSGTITAQNNKAGGIFGYLKNRCTLSKCYYYNPDQACQDGNPDSGSSKYTSISNILDDMNSLNNSDSDTYRKWIVSGSGVLEFE